MTSLCAVWRGDAWNGFRPHVKSDPPAASERDVLTVDIIKDIWSASKDLP